VKTGGRHIQYVHSREPEFDDEPKERWVRHRIATLDRGLTGGSISDAWDFFKGE